jgi:uncharacterized protein YdaL
MMHRPITNRRFPAWLRLLGVLVAAAAMLTTTSHAASRTPSASSASPAQPRWLPAPFARLAGHPGEPVPGAPRDRRTLVLYDSAADSAAAPVSGEVYGVQVANLVSHGSAFELRPVGSYRPGEMAGFSAVVYVGHSMSGQLPDGFLADVRSGRTSVLWLGYGAEQLSAGAPGYPAAIGWWPVGRVKQPVVGVSYKGVQLGRDERAGPPARIKVTDKSKVEVLAEGVQPDAGRIPWAVRSGTLTYVSEVPFTYVGGSDRYLAAADLIRALVSPPRRSPRALVRLEDVGPTADPAQLKQIADRLHRRGVPFTIGVYPRYRDPMGAFSGGVAVDLRLTDRPEVVDALRYMIDRGGSIVLHGYTHQHGEKPNPYNGVSGEDYEFYRARLGKDRVVELLGPVRGDSVQWANVRFADARGELERAGLPDSHMFEFPHYTASAADYQAATGTFGVRYDRGSYFPGWCSPECGGGTVPVDPAGIYTQTFPYLVRDVYGAVVVPENLGYIAHSSDPAELRRRVGELVSAARTFRVVDDGIASFFYHPYLGAEPLGRLVDGIQAAGYRFVTAAEVLED